jgi:streptogramin lyase
MSRISAFLLLALCTLIACDDPDSGNGVDSPTGPSVTNPPPSDNTPDDPASPLTELLSRQPSPRDLIFGPAGSLFADELFVVNFASAEALWIIDFESDNQQVGTVQNSLSGAIAVDADAAGNFYFACLTPVMGPNVGVITVRTLDERVPDFQYRGVRAPTGVALDERGRLFVANRNEGSVVRIDFADGNGRDSHTFTTVVEGLNFGAASLPNHLLVDPQGALFIAETAANQVRIWSPIGGLQVFAGSSQGLDLPVGIARRENGNILVTNNGDGSIVELDSTGQVVQRIDTGLGADTLFGIDVRADGRVYLVAGRSLYRLEM